MIMDFAIVLKFILEKFKEEAIDFALIGGFALQASGVTRATMDIDFLVLTEKSTKIKEIMLKHGYELLHESEDVLNFASKKFELGRVDFLLAHRKYTLAMLKRAEENSVFDGKFTVKVVKVEDQIGLKVQSSSNDPARYHQDMADIRALIKNNYSSLNMSLVEEYFSLFNRQKELSELRMEIESAK